MGRGENREEEKSRVEEGKRREHRRDEEGKRGGESRGREKEQQCVHV